MKVLFIGGTGIISSAVTPMAIEQGMDLYLLNRGQSIRPLPAGTTHLPADIHDPQAVEAVLSGHEFDVVVNWVAYVPEDVTRDIAWFRHRTRQYVFISSASAYQIPGGALPITEGTPLVNPIWPYSQQKIACENVLMQAHREEGFPVTIVRPSHTYDKTSVPTTAGRYTAMDRLQRGKPALIHGDGTSLWTLTHHRDFALGFVGLLGHPLAIGEAVHITSDEVLTWNQIHTILARAFGVEEHFVHVPSDLIHAYDPELGAGLLGDKASCKVFDNSKIKRLVPAYRAVIPFHQGAAEIAQWYREDPSRQEVDPVMDQMIDRILDTYQAVWPSTLF